MTVAHPQMEELNTAVPDSQHKIVTERARGEWTGGLRTEVRVRRFDPIIMDEPKDEGGTDTGPNPMEVLLGALIGCESVLMAMVAGEQNFSYSGVAFDLRGTLDLRGLEGVEGVRPYFEKVSGKIQVKTSEGQDALMRVAKEVERRCPVYTTLKAANVAFDVEWQAVAP